MADVWKRNLWAIEPLCQVVGGVNHTVILSGALGVPIRWNSFVPVNLTMRNIIKRFMSRSVPHFRSAAGACWCYHRRNERRSSGLKVAASFYAFPSASCVLMGSPSFSLHTSSALCMLARHGKPSLSSLGLEVILTLARWKPRFFGANLGRLAWYSFANDLSRQKGIGGDCLGVDPVKEALRWHVLYEGPRQTCKIIKTPRSLPLSTPIREL